MLTATPRWPSGSSFDPCQATISCSRPGFRGGGKATFPADRDAATEERQVIKGLVEVASENAAALVRAVRRLAHRRCGQAATIRTRTSHADGRLRARMRSICGTSPIAPRRRDSTAGDSPSPSAGRCTRSGSTWPSVVAAGKVAYETRRRWPSTSALGTSSRPTVAASSSAPWAARGSGERSAAASGSNKRRIFSWCGVAAGDSGAAPSGALRCHAGCGRPGEVVPAAPHPMTQAGPAACQHRARPASLFSPTPHP